MGAGGSAGGNDCLANAGDRGRQLDPQKNLTVITAVYFGLLVGVFLNYVAILPLTPILPKSGSPVADWLPLILGMLLCYICTSLLLQTRNDFRFLIPYVEFVRDVQGLRPNLLDSSAHHRRSDCRPRRSWRV